MKISRKHFFITIIVTLAEMIFLPAYMMTTFYRNTKKDALALGESTLAQEKEQAESHMSRALDIIQIISADACKDYRRQG